MLNHLTKPKIQMCFQVTIHSQRKILGTGQDQTHLFTKGKCNVLTCYSLCKGLHSDIEQTL